MSPKKWKMFLCLPQCRAELQGENDAEIVHPVEKGEHGTLVCVVFNTNQEDDSEDKYLWKVQ